MGGGGPEIANLNCLFFQKLEDSVWEKKKKGRIWLPGSPLMQGLTAWDRLNLKC